MTALCPCAAVVDPLDAMDDLHVYPRRRRGVKYQPYCVLCGPLTTPRGHRRIPAEVATAYRVGGLETVKALVDGDVKTYGKLALRLDYVRPSVGSA